jgi:hypothetical protein
MITLSLAQQLKAAGLTWEPSLHDFFALPEEFEDRAFVIADMPVHIATLQGEQVFAFEGAVEWALDTIVTTQAVWLPSESQLRRALEARLPEGPASSFVLSGLPAGYRLSVHALPGQPAFSATAAEDAYAQALLHLLATG